MVVSVSEIVARHWSPDEWARSQTSWDALLARSSADPLFLSWGWLTHWWQCYGYRFGHPPLILGFYHGADLVGLAPLYCRIVRRGGLFFSRSVQMIGLSWRDPAPLISEYLDVIAAQPYVAAVRGACVRELLESDWQELVIGLTAAGEQWRDAINAHTPDRRDYVRELDRSISYQARLVDGFGHYLKALGQSTRRSVWSLRQRLAQQGPVRLEQVTLAEIAEGLADLNRLHHLRWGKPGFSAKRLAFHTDLARRLSAAGELALSRLRVGKEVVSVLYDIRKGTRQYNIKMAFDPSFNARLSLGLIHLGYAMEAAVERGVTVYDFLAGPGQNQDYKRHLSQDCRELSCVQLLRGPVLPALYRWHDAAR